MKSIGRSLELSLAVHSVSGNPEQVEQRRTDISNMDNPLRRSIANSLEDLTINHRALASILLSGIARMTTGLTYLGNGAMSSVYRHGEQVVKVHRQTIGQTSETMTDYVNVHRDLCELAATHLGHIVVPQKFFVGEHPLGRYPVVLSRQPFIRGDRLDLFTPNTTELNKPALNAYCESDEEGLSQLRHLVQGTFDCNDHAGLVPDLNGADNFRVTDQGLQLIDGVPIPGEVFPTVHKQILQQAEVLGNFVRAA